MKILTGLISSLTLLSLNVVGLSQVEAQTQGFKFQIDTATFFGNGCPNGTAKLVLNGDTASVTFSKFEAKASPFRVVSASCSLRLPLNVPSGYNVQPIRIKYLGFADVPTGGSANLNVKILFQDAELSAINDPNQTFPAGFSNTWSKNINIVAKTINACNKPVSSVFGINSTLTARGISIPQNRETQIRIDTIDTTIGDVLYQIQFKFNPC
ncbi:DUF4360 domain-containing protein [Nostoc sphaeroides]|uniref:DUF4360 domain-containing protein n=1 Tax=Nostoc sphaeroides CCNUC1 TaxID=2653204 RepID=A0A5P8VXT9_9NOSO|nr:DUF4360 domain-containing protein [Nostoc sphaeroides]MCC5629566.1 DUF4360 domain-containing protein [Nostoc sphaeroides CHAB 2801]QFS45194.1 hypothetical protein GXM_02671 [Nostoc sphaeroides CCNUC1]